MISWFFFLKKSLNEGGDCVVEFNEWIKNPSKFHHAISRLIKKYVAIINKIQSKKLEITIGFSNIVDEFYLGNSANFLNPQYTWIDNTVTVIKYENLNNEFNEFFGKEIKLPIQNESFHDHFLNYYNKESLDIIYNRYKKDFKKYNYKKL